MAAIAAMSGHIVKLADLNMSTDNDCLLKSDTTSFVKIIGEVGKMHGAYMFYDKRRQSWRRVGKASGGGVDACFQGRYKGHQQALRGMTKSEFYWAFPLEGCINPAFCTKQQGLFHELVHCAAVAFRPTKIERLCADREAGGIVIWSESGRRSALQMRASQPQAKRAELAAYLFECVYGLMLAPHLNLSESMGFETIMIPAMSRVQQS